MAQISVIIPVYNCEKYIESCIQSVIDQTFSDWELVLINDGSTDHSPAICYQYAKTDSRIRVIEKENGGGGGEARNVGMQHATAPFFAFLDSDDLYKSTMLETLITAQQEGDYDCVVVGYEVFYNTDPARHSACYEDGTYQGKKAVRDFVIAHYPETLLGVPWNKLYRASIIRDHQLAMPKMRRLEDGIFNLEFYNYCGSLRVLNNIEYEYRESRQVEEGKLPYDFYDIMEVFVKHYYTVMEQWKYPRKEYERPMIDYFQNDFVSCLENLWRPIWSKTKEETYAYMRELRKKKLVSYMINQSCETGRYTKEAIAMFRKRHYKRLRLFMGMKHFLKSRCGSFFYRLKERVN